MLLEFEVGNNEEYKIDGIWNSIVFTTKLKVV